MAKVDFSNTREFLLIPSIPTPNGRLHLGHIAGPFLKMDIIKRFNEQFGNKAFLYGGTDSHDSYVLLKALQLDQTPEDVCNYYHSKNIEDLKKMWIHMDYFLNPIDPKASQAYITLMQNFFNELVKKNIAYRVLEKYPYSERFGYLPPGFISGVCPCCQNDMSGFICEDCGIAHKPEEILDKHYTIGNVEEKMIYSWFISIDKKKILEDLTSKNIPLYAREVVDRYVQQKRDIRLTVPSRWGVAASSESVQYNYGMFFPYCVFLAHLYRQQEHTLLNAFDQSSHIETVGSFGFDNISTFAINTLNHAHALKGFKGFSYYLPNRFMTLNQKKFSTTKNHAVWVNKIKDGISIDLVRLYLLKNNADAAPQDFDIKEFVSFYNKTANALNKKKFSSAKDAPNNDTEIFDSFLKQQRACLMPENYSGALAYQQIENWLALEMPLENWAKGFAIIAYPVMPGITSFIWRAFDKKGIPSPEGYKLERIDGINIPLIHFIDCSDIEVG